MIALVWSAAIILALGGLAFWVVGPTAALYCLGGGLVGVAVAVLIAHIAGRT